jgi:cobalt-zinc-cadmium efflux system outer membrane protein
MKKTQIITTFGIFVCLFISGCASEQDEFGFGRYEQIPVDTFRPSESVTGRQKLPELTESSGLSDYLAYAALNNAGLKAAFERWKAAIEQVPQAESLPDPKFTFGHFINEVETRVGPQRQKFGIMQTFPWFGEIEAGTDAAAASARAARKRYDAAKLKLFFEVKDAFHEYVYLAKAIQIAGKNLELIRHFEQVARTKYMVAAAGHPDVIRAQIELAKLEDQLKTLEDLRNPIVARLNAALNRRSFDMLPWPKREKFSKVDVNQKQMVALLKQMNPELAALDFEVEAAKSKVELAKKKFYPDIGVGVDWVRTDGALGAGVSDSGKDPIILMFTMNIPIWQDSYRAAERQAKANMNKAAQRKTQAKNTFIARAERLLYEFYDSDRKIKLYGDIIVPEANDLVAASETAYKAGTVDFLSLIDAQQTLLQYQLRYERAVTDNQQKLAELEMLVGTELPTVSEEPAKK